MHAKIANKYSGPFFRKILVPVIHGCETEMCIRVARAIAPESAVLLIGFVLIDPGESLSLGAIKSQELRHTLQETLHETEISGRPTIIVTHNLWKDLEKVIHEEKPDLLILDWVCHFDRLTHETARFLQNLTCDLILFRSPYPKNLKKILLPIRGGPHAELALKIALAIFQNEQARCTTLHLIPENLSPRKDAAFRGISRVLDNLPEFEKIELVGSDPESSILTFVPDYDLIIIGASAQSLKKRGGLGHLTDAILRKSPVGVLVVKTHRAIDFEWEQQEAGKQAITVLVDRWFAQNTYHADEFADLQELYNHKLQQNTTISLALPSLNEEETVGKVISTIKNALMDQVPLLDEIVLMDSNSTDNTRQIARELGIPVYIHQQTLPSLGPRHGKGEALWKSLYVTRGDIILWIDTDIVNIHPRFVYGLIGPLLFDPKINFVKGFYRRPIKMGDRILAGGGGRVTELTARPMINLFFPELSGVIQPLSGEYGGRRKLLERLHFSSGYGVEISLLIDVLKQSGLNSIAQVDLLERIHHNQTLEALSKMSFAIIQAVARKLEQYYGYTTVEDVNRTMKLIRYEMGRLYLDVEEIAERDRPAMLEIQEYLDCFSS